MYLTPHNKKEYLEWLENIRCKSCGFCMTSTLHTPSGKWIPDHDNYCGNCGAARQATGAKLKETEGSKC